MKSSPCGPEGKNRGLRRHRPDLRIPAVQDIQFALRRVLRAPAFSLGIVVILGAGIGATTAMVSVLDALVYRPIDVPQPHTLISVETVNVQGVRRTTPLAALELLGAAELRMDGWCGYSGGFIDSTEAGGTPMPAAVEFVTGECLRIVGVSPALGRWIDEDDAPFRGRGRSVAVISHQYWLRMFGGDPDVLGRTLRIHNDSVTVIGVMPAGFGGLRKDHRPDVIVPFNSYRPTSGAQLVIGRLEAGQTLDGVRAQIRAMWPSVLAAVLPAGQSRSGSPAASELTGDVQSLANGISLLRRLYSTPVSAMTALAAVLLLLTCVNVGGLLVSRVTARTAEIAMMRALGASSRRISGQMFAEGLIFALAGAAVGILVAYAAGSAFSMLLPLGLMPWTITLTPDMRILIAVSIASVALAGLISALPIWLGTRGEPMRGSDRTVAQQTSRSANVMLVAQLAVTVVLVFACGLMVRSFIVLTGADRGYRHHNVLSARLSPQPAGHKNLNQSAYYPELVERVSSLPGVQSVGFARYFGTLINTPPLQPIAFVGAAPDVTTGLMEYVSPRFFETVGIPLLRGRDVAWTDTPSSRAVVVVSESLARALVPDGNVVGKVIRYGTAAATARLEIVGVVGNVSLGDLRDRNVRVVYAPAIQAEQATLATLHIRTDGSPLALAKPTSDIVQSYSREYVNWALTIDDHFGNASVPERMAATASAVAAVLALTLAGLGVYALLAHAVSRRTREIGIRVAVGATVHDVLRLVVAGALALVLTGLAVGIPAAIGAAYVLRSLLYGVTTTDSVALAACAALLIGTGVIASLGPAMRAVRVDPVTALRAD